MIIIFPKNAFLVILKKECLISIERIIIQQSCYVILFLYVPHIEGLSERFNQICSKHNINVVNSVKNQKNSKLIIKGKDNLPKDDKMNLIYKIKCDNCSAVYVG